MGQTIRSILDEVANTQGDKAKVAALTKYQDNELLKRVLYLAKSKRVKFYIRQIPPYTTPSQPFNTLEDAMRQLSVFSERKVTGNNAVHHLASTLGSLSSDDAYVIERIIDKDLKFGLSTTHINKVFKALIEKTGYMGCKPYNEAKVAAVFAGGKMGVSEVKADGRFSNAVISGNIAELESRQGEEVLIGECTLMAELSKFPDCVLNGEFVIPQFKREISNGIMTSIINITKKINSDDASEFAKGEASRDKLCKKYDIEYQDLLDSITYIVWDILDIDEYYANNSTKTRHERLNRLNFTVTEYCPTKIKVVEHKFVSSVEEALEHFAEKLAAGEEGTVLKTLDGLWRDGKRYNQIKLKIEFDVDLKIVGFNYGTKGTKNENVISSLQCESSDGLLSTQPQGLTEEQMLFVTENQDVLLGTVAECKCNGISQDNKGNYSLMYPALKSFRDDKNVADSLEDIIANENMVKGVVTVHLRISK